MGWKWNLEGRASQHEPYLNEMVYIFLVALLTTDTLLHYNSWIRYFPASYFNFGRENIARWLGGCDVVDYSITGFFLGISNHANSNSFLSPSSHFTTRSSFIHSICNNIFAFTRLPLSSCNMVLRCSYEGVMHHREIYEAFASSFKKPHRHIILLMVTFTLRVTCVTTRI